MSDTSEDLRSRLVEQSTESLLQMVNVDFADYRDEALEIARAELRRRGIRVVEPKGRNDESTVSGPRSQTVRKVFVAQHPTEAHLLKGLLESQGIAAEVRGEALFSVRGEVPATPDTLPSVWVMDETQVARALEFVAEYERGTASTSEHPWRCPNCGETLDPQFTACWQCGTARPSVQ